MGFSKSWQLSFSSLLWGQSPFFSMLSLSYNTDRAMNALTLQLINGNHATELSIVYLKQVKFKDNMRLEFSGVSIIRIKTAFTI